MAKGRKPKTKPYFGKEEEQAVVDFLSLGQLVESETAIDGWIWSGTTEQGLEREKIYVRHLKDPLNKMIESIIRRYKLYSKEMTFEDLHSDTLSFLMIKFHKFKPEKGKKSYSYYGTVCKHYLLGKLIKSDKKLKMLLPFDDVSSKVEERDEMSYTIDNDEPNLTQFIQQISNSIKDEMEDSVLNDNETKVGKALTSILDNWETLFEDGGNKYNKNLILLYMREMTALTTKDIRNGMKRYKVIYKMLKDSL